MPIDQKLKQLLRCQGNRILRLFKSLFSEGKLMFSYPADIVLALCGDGLIDHFLAANAEENFFNFVQEFLQKQIHLM